MQNLPQFVPQKVCLSCDGCCRFKEQESAWRPKMTQDEIALNATGRDGLAKELFSSAVDEHGYVKAVSCQGIIKCTFFNTEDNTCQIYEQRPFECRLYPFLLIKQDPCASVGVHLSCPHVQEKWEKEEFNEYVAQLKQYFQREEVLHFIRNNQRLLGEYTTYKDEIAHIFSLDY